VPNSFDITPKMLWCVLILLFLSASVPSHAQTGPTGWWKLDEGTGTTTADSSGGAHPGTLVGTPAWTTGRVGPYAITFNGTTQSVSVSGSGTLANLYVAGMTVAAWIKPAGSGGGGGGRIVDKDNNDAGWFFAMSGTTTVKFTADQFTTSASSRTSTAAITANTWQHVVATWAGSTSGTDIHIYINGVLADGASTAGSGTAYDDSTTPLTIGNRPVDNARGFSGAIDEIRVYNRVLTTAEIQALADSTVPGAPTGLSATAASSSQINLSWTASTDNIGVTGYLVERCLGGTGCSSFTQIGSPTGTSYSDVGLAASTSYTYRVRATDTNSNLSAYSSPVSKATLVGGGDTSPPSQVTGLGATVLSTTQINLAWTAATDNVGVTGYRVERCAGASCTNFVQVGTPTSTTYSDTGLSAGTTYRYQVRATDAAGNLGAYSSPPVSATTSASGDTQPPTAPTLSILAASSTEIDLTWSGSTDNVGVTGYFVERCAGAGCTNFTSVGSPTAPPFYSPGLSPATPYSYRVRAGDAAGNQSANSNVVSMTTPANSPDCN
jgi:fibronectin type 3 domain-containing protein